VKQGSNVDVVVSAGSEEFSMPDVIGNGLLLARGVLEAKGLELKIETEPSEQPSDTVLSTNPAAGSLVRTGDVVRVTVAAAGSGSSALLPLNLQGVAVILDPAPVPAKQLDVPLEVARRVRSLIEASGGTVVTTRALADTGTASAAPARAKRAKEGSATLAIGLEVSPTGPRGAVAYYPLSGPQALVASSKNLASQIATSLTDSGIAAQASSTTTDAVLSTRAITWSRVRLGSLTAREDVASFRDPAWADTVARAIYRAIADLYGRKSASP
jgi:N-acetylmuramoyl-L-alanine amidase